MFFPCGCVIDPGRLVSRSADLLPQSTRRAGRMAQRHRSERLQCPGCQLDDPEASQMPMTIARLIWWRKAPCHRSMMLLSVRRLLVGAHAQQDPAATCRRPLSKTGSPMTGRRYATHVQTAVRRLVRWQLAESMPRCYRAMPRRRPIQTQRQGPRRSEPRPAWKWATKARTQGKPLQHEFGAGIHG